MNHWRSYNFNYLSYSSTQPSDVLQVVLLWTIEYVNKSPEVYLIISFCECFCDVGVYWKPFIMHLPFWRFFPLLSYIIFEVLHPIILLTWKLNLFNSLPLHYSSGGMSLITGHIDKVISTALSQSFSSIVISLPIMAMVLTDFNVQTYLWKIYSGLKACYINKFFSLALELYEITFRKNIFQNINCRPGYIM